MCSSLYIHIPFCVRKCIYCDFLSIPYDDTIARRYADALCRELHMKKNSAGELKTVYFGGGTPSLLPADCFSRIFGCIKDEFPLSPSAEISLEANPGTISAGMLASLAALGVNRLSVGIQSFHDSELRTLGRIHDAQKALGAIELMRAAGLKNFSIDLMYGIPGQTSSSWAKTLSVAAGLSPSHISAYELTPEKNTALIREIQAGRIEMPDEEMITEMYSSAIDFLASRGYGHYEISNYSMPGFECLHNMNYWDRGEYIGAGAGAHSFLDGFRFRNARDILKYIRLSEEGILQPEDRCEVTHEDAAREFLFLGLRKTEGISILKAQALGIHIEDSCLDLFDDGYIESDGNRIRLTRKGLVISNTVIVKIFEHSGL